MELRLKCLDCQQSEIYKDEKELEAHIAGDHMHIFEFGCKTCKHGRFPTAYAMSDHQLVVHKDHSLPDCHLYEYPGDTRLKALKKRVEECVEVSKQPEVVDLTQEVLIIAEKSIGSVKCLYCEQAVVFHTMEKLEAHIAEDHLKSFPFRCSKCPFVRFSTEYILRCHYNEDHQTTEFELIMNFSSEICQKRLEVTAKVIQCLQACEKPAEVKKPRNRKKQKGPTADSSVEQKPAAPASVIPEPFNVISENPVALPSPTTPIIEGQGVAGPPVNAPPAVIPKQTVKPVNSVKSRLKRGTPSDGKPSAPPAKRAKKGTSFGSTSSSSHFKEGTAPSELVAPIVQPKKVEYPENTAKAHGTLVENRKRPNPVESVRHAFAQVNPLKTSVGTPQRSHTYQEYTVKIRNPYWPISPCKTSSGVSSVPAGQPRQISHPIVTVSEKTVMKSNALAEQSGILSTCTTGRCPQPIEQIALTGHGNGIEHNAPKPNSSSKGIHKDQECLEQIHNPYRPLNPYLPPSGVSRIPADQSKLTGRRPTPVEKAELYGHVIKSYLKNPIKIEELPEHSRIELLAALQDWVKTSSMKLGIEQNAPKPASKPDSAPIGIQNPYRNPYVASSEVSPVPACQPIPIIHPTVTVPEKAATKSNALAEHSASSTIESLSEPELQNPEIPAQVMNLFAFLASSSSKKPATEQYIAYLQSYQNIALNPEAPQMGSYYFPWK